MQRSASHQSMSSSAAGTEPDGVTPTNIARPADSDTRLASIIGSIRLEEPKDNVLFPGNLASVDDDDVSIIAIDSSMGDVAPNTDSPPDHDTSGLSSMARRHFQSSASPTHGSPTRSELDFDVESQYTASSSSNQDPVGTINKAHHHLLEGTPRMVTTQSPRQITGTDEGIHPPPTPSKNTLPSASALLLTRKTLTKSSVFESPTQGSGQASCGFWSPSLNGGSPSPARTLSRTGILKHGSELANSYETSFDSPNRRSSCSRAATAEKIPTPRSAKCVNRRRMSIEYVLSASTMAGPPGGPSPLSSGVGPYLPSPCRRPHLPQRTPSSSMSGPFGSLGKISHDRTSSISSYLVPNTPQADVSTHFYSVDTSPTALSPSDTSGAIQAATVMDLSKHLLAEIARRERRVGELKAELKKEENELQDIRQDWQKFVVRDLATQARCDEERTAKRRQMQEEETLATLRAPRRRSGAPKLAHDEVAHSQSSARGLGNSQPASGAQSSPMDVKVDVPQLSTGVTDALRGFSARLSSGLSTQFNSILEGLNVPPSPLLTKGTSIVATDMPASSLSALLEETEADSGHASLGKLGARVKSSALPDMRPNSQPTQSAQQDQSTSSKPARPSPLAASSPVQPASHNTQIILSKDDNGDAPSGASGWAVSWSKRIRDAAVRAERVLGEAMTVEGLSPPAQGIKSGSSQPTNGDFLFSNQHYSSRLEGKHAVNRCLERSAASNVSNGSAGLGGNQPVAGGSHSWVEQANAREKSALAELELGWLSNLASGGRLRDSKSSLAKKSCRPSISRSPSPGVTAGGEPQKMSPRTLLALADGDGLIPDGPLSRNDESGLDKRMQLQEREQESASLLD